MLTLAREMTTNIAVSDAIFDAARACFDKEVLVELVMEIAHYASVARFLAALKTDLQPDDQSYLDKSTLPA